MNARSLALIALMTVSPTVLTGCPDDECPAYPNQNPNIDCDDEDGDGYCAVCCADFNADGTLCQPDCDDSDPWTNPGMIDDHHDGLDANCDGQDVTPVVTPPDDPPMPTPEVCGNGLDDDGNGFADCADAACAQACLTEPEQLCNLAQNIGAGATYTLSFGNYLDGLSSCAGAEVVVKFTTNVPGELSFTLSDTHYVTPMTTCAPEQGSCELVEGAVPRSFHIDGDTYFVIESLGNAGTVELTATFTPNHCGDGVIQGSEECDDGNKEIGDGCDATCATEHFYTTCQQAPELSEGVTVVDTISMGTNMVESTCSTTGEPEYLYVYTPAENGTLTLALENAGPASLFVRNVCTAEPLDLSCDVAADADPALLYVPAIAGSPLYVFVDGFDLAENGATLTALFNAH